MNSGSSVLSRTGEAFDNELESSDKEEEEVGDGDVTCGRSSDLGFDSPKQPEILPSKYQLTAFGRKLRGFNPGWFSGCPRGWSSALNVVQFLVYHATR